MFDDRSICAESMGALNYELRPPVDERVAQFKRLCGADAVFVLLVGIHAPGRHAMPLTQKSGQTHIKTWSQVLDDNRARMQFFQERLEFQADKGDALKHLQERYAGYLEGVLEAEDQPAADPAWESVEAAAERQA